jgi:hypothetical protein
VQIAKSRLLKKYPDYSTVQLDGSISKIMELPLRTTFIISISEYEELLFAKSPSEISAKKLIEEKGYLCKYGKFDYNGIKQNHYCSLSKNGNLLVLMQNRSSIWTWRYSGIDMNEKEFKDSFNSGWDVVNTGVYLPQDGLMAKINKDGTVTEELTLASTNS